MTENKDGDQVREANLDTGDLTRSGRRRSASADKQAAFAGLED